MVIIKRLLVSILYWWLLFGLYFFFSNLEVNGETLKSALGHLYYAFVYLWYIHIAIAAIFAFLSYFDFLRLLPKEAIGLNELLLINFCHNYCSVQP